MGMEDFDYQESALPFAADSGVLGVEGLRFG